MRKNKTEQTRAIRKDESSAGAEPAEVDAAEGMTAPDLTAIDDEQLALQIERAIRHGDDDAFYDDEDAVPGGRAWIRYARLAFAAALFLLGVFIVVLAFDFGWESRGAPGPGFFPFWVGLLIALTAVGWGITEFRTSIDSQIPQDLDPEGVWRVLRIVFAFAVLIIIFEPVGYNLSVLAFMLFMSYSMGKGKGRVWVMVIVSLCASFGVYLAFQYGLGVRLPNSIIPFLAQLGL